jgi:hypothetical protein
VRHICEEIGPDLVGDLTELGTVDRPRTRTAAADNHSRPNLACNHMYLIVVIQPRRSFISIERSLTGPSAGRRVVAVAQMTPLGEIHAEIVISRLQDSEVDSPVCVDP